MSDLRKAAEMALEALENIGRWLPTIGQKGLRDYEADAIQALRQALAESANSTTDFVEPKASSQTEQEPVAWVLHRELFWPSEYEVISEAGDNAIPLYTAPPKREWVGLTDEEYENFCSLIQREEARLKEKNT